ncbi:1-deoxy-D-xylulose-5-phosphate reductoisomerase [Rickettsiales bacterium]|nr:1-deoxy-D-xylulose-5-phosphate reductoisomerase [Rickettsiales bacterium]
MSKKKITIFGSTGSVGNSTLDVLSCHPEKFELVGLTINKNYKKLLKQVKLYKPKVVSIKDNNAFKKFSEENQDKDLVVLGGQDSLVDILELKVDFIMAAIVGAAGLLPVIEAAKKGINIGLANKESLVCSGNILKNILKTNRSKILPIDSEHNAIFQVFENSNINEIEKIILTASGGPFRGKKQSELLNITPSQAVLHPNWEMGKKISVDSATLMNKGLEFIEAHYLFDMPVDKIEVLVHPQSIVHSCVEYSDGSVLAQMGTPDMKTPIAYALGYPDRISAPIKRLDLSSLADLSFMKPDNDTFPALNLAIQALKIGGSAPTILNAANEIAVGAFLENKIPFLSITKIVDLTINKSNICEINSIEEVLDVDIQARKTAKSFVRLEK